MATGRNPIALNNAAEAALQQGKSPLALDLFTRMKLLGMPLRAHYFWPILLLASKTYGEKGDYTLLIHEHSNSHTQILTYHCYALFLIVIFKHMVINVLFN